MCHPFDWHKMATIKALAQGCEVAKAFRPRLRSQIGITRASGRLLPVGDHGGSRGLGRIWVPQVVLRKALGSHLSRMAAESFVAQASEAPLVEAFNASFHELMSPEAPRPRGSTPVAAVELARQHLEWAQELESVDAGQGGW